MAMMMTGRVLLVCALCVLWCGLTGGVYARDLDSRALGDCMALGVLGVNGSHVRSRCNKYMPTLRLRSALPISAMQAEDVQVLQNSEDVTNLTRDTSSVPGPDGGSGDQAVPGAIPGAVPAVVPGAVPGSSGTAGSLGDSPVLPTGVGPGAAAAAGSPSVTGSIRGAIPSVDAGDPGGSSAVSEDIQTGCGTQTQNCGDQQSREKTMVQNQDLGASNSAEQAAAENINPKDNEENPTGASTTELPNKKTQQ
ncbi:mucin-associated surface protein (MASP), putative, partial [Trypanosoma cruzi marinkellei]